MRDMMRKSCVCVIATIVMVAVSAVSPVVYADASSEPFSISLTREDGTELVDPLFSGVTFYFDTYTHPDNVVEYRLIAMVTIPSVPANLVISSQGGEFEVDVSIEGLQSFLAETGIVMTLESQDVQYEAKLNASDQFHSKFKDGTDVALFEPNCNYELTISTDDGYSSVVPPTSIQDIKITFHAVLAQGHHLVVFESEGSIVESYVAYDNDTIDHLPSVSRPGYTLKGWYTPDGREITEGYTISPDEGDIYAYAQWEKDENNTLIVPIIGGTLGVLAVAAALIVFLLKKKKEETPPE